jgi:hypothetical protein
MSRTSFDRDDGVRLYQDQSEIEGDDLYIEPDTILESEMLETSLDDYDDLLSVARDDYEYLGE